LSGKAKLPKKLGVCKSFEKTKWKTKVPGLGQKANKQLKWSNGRRPDGTKEKCFPGEWDDWKSNWVTKGVEEKNGEG